ncbi:Tat (twin-arginine translocation) pathway signal sequence containing protein [Robertkochia flava]|uniref:Tat (twin-arginine translocation) pathway signal sequence containing protein n=1 Tax=Robertkochia flava TaxID=3447986 RepID=UPI001CCDB314|nr:Tat (twin-arginine translocation) pathway signal sequence containing protein [Robertkochia marina]
MEQQSTNPRRNFLGLLAMGATASGLSMFANTAMAVEALNFDVKALQDSDEWFKKIKGSHRVVYDGTTPHDGLPVLWTYAFYETNNATGTPDDDMTAVCVLRHNAIPFAMKDSLWYQYKLGEFFGINDNQTGKPSLRNTVYEPINGDFPIPGVPGIKKMQERGVMFCVCDLALKVYSGFIAESMDITDKDRVYEEFKVGILPDIQIVPSGVWALERAHQNNCAYIFAGN